MRKQIKALTVSLALVAAVAATSPLNASDGEGTLKSVMGSGMMDDHEAGGMTEGCRMMGGQNTPKPSEQWRHKAPGDAEKKS